MNRVLTEHGLRLTYLRDPESHDELDEDRILADLTDESSDSDPLLWLGRHGLTGYDHLVLVTERHNGRFLAFLAANDSATQREDFLSLETAFVTACARGQNLTRRMIAFAVLRIGSVGQMPSVIAARRRSPICHRIMRGLAHRITGANLYPNPEDVAIDFYTVFRRAILTP